MSEPEPFTKLFQRVKSQVPSCADALIRQEISNTLLDFTQDTNIWQETFDMNVVPTQLIYPLTVTVGTANRLMLVYKDTDPWRRWADNWITMRVPATIELARGMAQNELWHAVIAKATSTPMMTDDTPPVDTGYPEIDEWIVDQFSDTIYYGTMWFLQRMPAKSFRDPAGAKENSALYGSSKTQAKVQAMRMNVYNGQSWTYPQSFATISRKGWQ